MNPRNQHVIYIKKTNYERAKKVACTVQSTESSRSVSYKPNQTRMQKNNCTHHYRPEDSWVLRAKAHQILECRIMKRPGWQGSRAKGIFVQEKGDEEGQQDCHQLRT